MRGVALLSAALLAWFGLIVAAHAQLVATEWAPASRVWLWIVVGYSAVGVLANASTPSRAERRLWLPVLLAMLASSLFVALAT